MSDDNFFKTQRKGRLRQGLSAHLEAMAADLARSRILARNEINESADRLLEIAQRNILSVSEELDK